MDILGYFKYLGKRFYPMTHTRIVYDDNGQVLEDRLSNDESEIDKKANTSDLSDVATSGEYGDLGNKPITPVYAECSTDRHTAVKTATTEDEFVLTKGAIVYIRFKNDSVQTAISLNVNNTGAKLIKQYGSVAPVIGMWQPNAIVAFVYDGTYWIMTGREVATTSKYGTVQLSSNIAAGGDQTVPTTTAVKELHDTLSDHISAQAENNELGHVCLSDNIEEDADADSTTGIATTPKAVKDAISSVVLTAHDTDSLTAALTSIKDTGGKIVLTGNVTIPPMILTEEKQYIIEGTSKDIVATYNRSSCAFGARTGTIIFRDLTVNFAANKRANYIFDNCTVLQCDDLPMCDNINANLTFLKSDIIFYYRYDSDSSQFAIKRAHDIVIDNDSYGFVQADNMSDYDGAVCALSFIYQCNSAKISNSVIKSWGELIPVYLFGRGVYTITNNDLRLVDDGNSLFHEGVFGNNQNILSNNQIYINGGTHLNCAIISNNTFQYGSHQDGSTSAHHYYGTKLWGMSQIIGNIFYDSPYIDCNYNNCIIKDNMGTLVITNTTETSMIKDNLGI